MSRACAWLPCSAPMPAEARGDARYCGRRCRQAAWRLREQVGLAAQADRPLRLAYGDPPYPGRALLYYRDHPDYAGEVDHGALLERLASYDGWALSTSSDALPELLRLADDRGLRPRVAAWLRGPRPGAGRGPRSAWEPVLYVSARAVVSPTPGSDALVWSPKARRSDPRWVTGAKPWAFCRWLFAELLQARAGDQLDDLYPGSGGVSLAWASWTSSPAPSDSSASDTSAAADDDGRAA